MWAIFKSTSQQSYSHGSNICPLILVFKELFLRVSVLPTRSIQSTHRSQEKAVAPLERELKRKLGTAMWELNPGPLEGHQGPFTTEPSLQAFTLTGKE